MFRERRDVVLAITIGLYLIGTIVIAGINIGLLRDGTFTTGTFTERIIATVVCPLIIAVIFGIERLFRIRFPFFIEMIIPIYVFFALGLGIGLRFYDRVHFYDKVMHFIAGIFFTISGYLLATLLLKDHLTGTRKLLVYTVIALLVPLAEGYIWEMGEFIFDTIFPLNAQRWADGLLETIGDGTYLFSNRRGSGLMDTMSDLIINFVGSVVTVVALTPFLAKKPKTYQLFYVRTYPKDETLLCGENLATDNLAAAPDVIPDGTLTAEKAENTDDVSEQIAPDENID